ncbi:hypothetical protein [Nocardioides zeae]|uniref:hypothetical protein n=1 Tax=Nocardioides zeae TaxID=1457234 RepID=UPI00286AE939|nr:hypothetical protein [Nocardioides zeae]
MDGSVTRRAAALPRVRRGRLLDGGLDVLAVVAAVLLLGPALAPGVVLSYDMVWVHDLAVTAAGWGWTPGVPRAVPSDQVVALLDEVVPGALLQKVVLLGALVGGGAGAHRLLRGTPGPLGVPVRALAAVLVVWNPFTVERLLLGHWPLLLAAAVLPWSLLAGRRLAGGGSLPRWWPPLVALGSLSASAGLLTALGSLLLVGGVGRARRRTWGWIGAVLVAANAPWVVAGALAGGTTLATPDAARTAAEVFAARGPDGIPTGVALLGLGGVWNAQTVPASLTGPRAWAWALLVLVALAALAVRAARAPGEHRERREPVLLLVGAGIAVGAPLLGQLLPGLVALVSARVPGGGVLRDGSRLVALALPAVVVGLGALPEVLARRRHAEPGGARGEARGPRAWAVVGAGVAGALLPVALLPDALGGAGGALRAVAPPTSYAEARDLLADGGAGATVLSLPFSAYRAPAWNHGRPVLDPLPRALGAVRVVASDELVVGGRPVAGESPLTAEVLAALSRPTPAERTEALCGLGVTHVARARGADVDGAPGRLAPALEESQELASPELELGALTCSGDLESRVGPRPAETASLVVAWSAFALCLLAGLASRRARRTSPS